MAERRLVVVVVGVVVSQWTRAEEVDGWADGG
jgi:hypothetical protein